MAVATTLAANNTDLLARRAAGLGHFIQERGLPPGGPGLGLSFGGEASGTLALAVRPDGTVAGAGPTGSIAGLPDQKGVEAARADGSSVRDLRIDTRGEREARATSTSARTASPSPPATGRTSSRWSATGPPR